MVEFDPFSESYFEDPFPIYKQLRDEAPAFYHEELDCYFLSRFGDIWEAVNSGHFSHRKGTNSQDLLVGKPPNLALSSMVPPARSATRAQTESPRPVPTPTGLVVKKGSKIRFRLASGMPTPVSRTSSSATSPTVRVERVMV